METFLSTASVTIEALLKTKEAMMNSSKMNCEPLVFEKERLVGIVLLGMTILEGGSGSVTVVRVMKALAGMENSRLCIQLQISPIASLPILLVNKMY